jgi:drug/metabolite transporter (DMT)-like permease
MTGPVLLVVLAAAILHAVWNAIAKAVRDRRVTACLLATAGLLPAIAGVVALPTPDPGVWPYLAASSVASTVYLLLLTHAYQHGEFGQVYPLARGLPPLLVTLFALGILDEHLTRSQLAGVAVISLALSALVFANGPPKAGVGLGPAAAAGAMIATYTIIDGIGVRESGHALSYAAWRLLLEGVLVLAASRVLVGAGLWQAARPFAALGLTGGLLAVAAFTAVLWAQSQAPLALVSAVRESSLLFAAAIGMFVFRERLNATRLAATVAAAAGIVLINTA